MTAAETSRPVYAVIGSGYMGGGIAQVLALSGADVLITDADLAQARANRERLIAEAERFAADDLFPADAAAVIAERITADVLEEAAARASFIMEVVPERLELKHETLARISAAASPEAVIGSNTSTILIGSLAEAVVRPERFLGVHFANPAPFIPGVELIAHAGTDPEAVATAERIVTAAGKSPARVGDATGFVMNRLQYALFHEATQLVAEGVATPEAIDTVVRSSFGFRMPLFGPFAVADMAGLDVYAFCYASLQTEFPERFATPPMLAERVADGRFGTKTGSGFFDLTPEQARELVAYRDSAYAAMSRLLAELGPSPLG